MIPDSVPTRSEVLSVHVPRLRPDPLVVVRKTNGGKTDSLNVGINLAKHPLVCMVDADSVLDPQALLSVAKPFADDPLRTVAAGGVVRVANGCTVVAGRIVDIRMPRGWLPRIQVVEYLRAFLLGRTGWSRIGGLLVISGAFGVFRRDILIDIDGLDHDTIGEDAELVVRLHRHMRTLKRDYRIVFVAEPVSWSETPSTFGVLAKQRRRWHRGITEILTQAPGGDVQPALRPDRPGGAPLLPDLRVPGADGRAGRAVPRTAGPGRRARSTSNSPGASSPWPTGTRCWSA